jgi:hypothetical protein
MKYHSRKKFKEIKSKEKKIENQELEISSLKESNENLSVHIFSKNQQLKN